MKINKQMYSSVPPQNFLSDAYNIMKNFIFFDRLYNTNKCI